MLWHIDIFMTNLRKWKKLTHVLHFLTSTVKPKSYGDKTQMFLCSQRGLPSFPCDRWRNCWLDSINSIGSECCLGFVIFLQPMVRVTIIHDWIMTFIVVHDRFMTNGYALPVPHVLGHKMDLQWKPQSNLYKKFHTCTTWIEVIKISTALHTL